MEHICKFLLVISLWSAVLCSPFDNGKYKPKVVSEYDDGKYYRPPDEGKYVPGDEGKYTYIYTQGVFPYDGTYKHLGRGDSNLYIGYQIYAPRFPYMYAVIDSILNKYVSKDIAAIEEAPEASTNQDDKVSSVDPSDNEIAMKCKFIEPESKEEKNATEFVTQYPPHIKLEEGEKLGTFYNFKGTKVLNKVSNSVTTKLKLQYDVFVRVVEEVSE